MRIVAIIQARMGSMRLPGKVMKPLGGSNVLGVMLKRVEEAKEITDIMVAVTDSESDDLLVEFLSSRKTNVFRGSETDVLDRFFHAATSVQADVVVRLTADCPLIDSDIIDDVVRLFLEKKADYAANTKPPAFPDGLDVEVFSFAALATAHKNAESAFDREHVTPFLRTGHFKCDYLHAQKNFRQHRWTLDRQEDLEVITNIVDWFAPNLLFSWKDVLALASENPMLFRANSRIQESEGTELNSGQKLWLRANQIIPSGNMLFSKRPELHLPRKWPTYFTKTKGIKVWDLDGLEYRDFYLMGVGTNIFGYSYSPIDDAVGEVIQKGNMSTFNAPEEVYLADKLISINPWASMAKFARSGGEANAIAVRIARAASGRDGVAVCGYHGWHDWYLSANLSSSSNLNTHLMPGLGPLGVPKSLEKTVFPFEYNDFERLKQIITENEVGVIKMEVFRNKEPEDNFLQEVRRLASNNNVVLIFDECTSGFRETFGGLHKKFNVTPDIVVYGKTLGNGYAISAVVGIEEVMSIARETFISSTFWTERIGSVAGLTVLEQMSFEKPWKKVTEVGTYLQDQIGSLASKHYLDVKLSGLPALTTYSFESENATAYKTYVTQEFLKHRILAGTTFYLSTCHTKELIDEYIDILDGIFAMLAKCEAGLDIESLLEQPVCDLAFKRLN